jgi:hypothetical protein
MGVVLGHTGVIHLGLGGRFRWLGLRPSLRAYAHCECGGQQGGQDGGVERHKDSLNENGYLDPLKNFID